MANFDRLSDAKLVTEKISTADWVKTINDLPEELVKEIVKAKNIDKNKGKEFS